MTYRSAILLFCLASAVVASPCGDGIVNGTEECDDGNTIDNDACRNNCTYPEDLIHGNCTGENVCEADVISWPCGEASVCYQFALGDDQHSTSHFLFDLEMCLGSNITIEQMQPCICGHEITRIEHPSANCTNNEPCSEVEPCFPPEFEGVDEIAKIDFNTTNCINSLTNETCESHEIVMKITVAGLNVTNNSMVGYKSGNPDKTGGCCSCNSWGFECVLPDFTTFVLTTMRPSTTSPVANTTWPIPSTTSPEASTTSPVLSITTPRLSTTSPVASITSQVASTTTPGRSTTSRVPSTTSPEPSTTSPVPSTTSPDHSTTSPILSTTSPEPSTTSPEPSTTSPVVSTSSPVPSTTSPMPSTTTPRHSTTSPVPSTTSPLPSATSPVPSTTTPMRCIAPTETRPASTQPACFEDWCTPVDFGLCDTGICDDFNDCTDDRCGDTPDETCGCIFTWNFNRCPDTNCTLMNNCSSGEPQKRTVNECMGECDDCVDHTLDICTGTAPCACEHPTMLLPCPEPCPWNETMDVICQFFDDKMNETICERCDCRVCIRAGGIPNGPLCIPTPSRPNPSTTSPNPSTTSPNPSTSSPRPSLSTPPSTTAQPCCVECYCDVEDCRNHTQSFRNMALLPGLCTPFDCLDNGSFVKYDPQVDELRLFRDNNCTDEITIQDTGISKGNGSSESGECWFNPIPSGGSGRAMHAFFGECPRVNELLCCPGVQVACCVNGTCVDCECDECIREGGRPAGDNCSVVTCETPSTTSPIPSTTSPNPSTTSPNPSTTSPNPSTSTPNPSTSTPTSTEPEVCCLECFCDLRTCLNGTNPFAQLNATVGQCVNFPCAGFRSIRPDPGGSYFGWADENCTGQFEGADKSFCDTLEEGTERLLVNPGSCTGSTSECPTPTFPSTTTPNPSTTTPNPSTTTPNPSTTTPLPPTPTPPPVCGDGIVNQIEEECDLGPENDDNGCCTTNCTCPDLLQDYLDGVLIAPFFPIFGRVNETTNETQLPLDDFPIEAGDTARVTFILTTTRNCTHKVGGLYVFKIADNWNNACAVNVFEMGELGFFDSTTPLNFSLECQYLGGGIAFAGGVYEIGLNVTNPEDMCPVRIPWDPLVERPCGNNTLDDDEECDDGGVCFQYSGPEAPVQPTKTCTCDADCGPLELCFLVLGSKKNQSVCFESYINTNISCLTSNETGCGFNQFCVKKDSELCDRNCKFKDGMCGNEVVEPPETCDPPDSTLPNGNNCTQNCTFCGDGMVDPGEECDDGNNFDFDECHNNCTNFTCPPLQSNILGACCEEGRDCFECQCDWCDGTWYGPNSTCESINATCDECVTNDRCSMANPYMDGQCMSQEMCEGLGGMVHLGVPTSGPDSACSPFSDECLCCVGIPMTAPTRPSPMPSPTPPIPTRPAPTPPRPTLEPSPTEECRDVECTALGGNCTSEQFCPPPNRAVIDRTLCDPPGPLCLCCLPPVDTPTPVGQPTPPIPSPVLTPTPVPVPSPPRPSESPFNTADQCVELEACLRANGTCVEPQSCLSGVIEPDLCTPLELCVCCVERETMDSVPPLPSPVPSPPVPPVSTTTPVATPPETECPVQQSCNSTDPCLTAQACIDVGGKFGEFCNFDFECICCTLPATMPTPPVPSPAPVPSPPAPPVTTAKTDPSPVPSPVLTPTPVDESYCLECYTNLDCDGSDSNVTVPNGNCTLFLCGGLLRSAIRFDVAGVRVFDDTECQGNLLGIEGPSTCDNITDFSWKWSLGACPLPPTPAPAPSPPAPAPSPAVPSGKPGSTTAPSPPVPSPAPVPSPPSSQCGNGILEPPEQCDDDNLNDGDGCTSNCTIETSTCCWFIWESNSDCSGNVSLVLPTGGACVNTGINGTGFNSVICNGALANAINQEGCTLGGDVLPVNESTCTSQDDNSGVVLFGNCYEAPIMTPTPPLTPTPPVVVCGNGNVEGDEECDDNNLNGGDGCSATCTIESSDCCWFIFEGSTSCMSGVDLVLPLNVSTCVVTNVSMTGFNSVRCLGNITASFNTLDCGQGPLAGDPTCANLNPDANSGFVRIGNCYDLPTFASVQDRDHDGVPDSRDNCPGTINQDQHDRDFDGVGDACDNCIGIPNRDQNDRDNDRIGDVCDPCPDDDTNTCVEQHVPASSECGNGLLESGESCDDGNTQSGDGCSSACHTERCHVCSGEPSRCIRVCRACCLPDNTCIDSSASLCTSQSGTSQHRGSQCSDADICPTSDTDTETDDDETHHNIVQQPIGNGQGAQGENIALQKTDFETGELIGITAGVVVGLLLILLCFCLFMYVLTRRREKQGQGVDASNTYSDFPDDQLDVHSFLDSELERLKQQ